MGSERQDHLQKGSEVSAYESLIAGSISGGIARLITAPLDTIKIRLQLQTQDLVNYQGATKTLRAILKNEGMLALWKGNVPAEIMYVLYGAVQFTSYSVISKYLSEVETNFKINLSSSTHSLLVGLGSGVCSTLTTYPLDLLRTRLAANSSKSFISMSKSIRSIWKKDGMRGYFFGIKPAMLSVASTTALMFWTYELARDFSRDYSRIPFIEGFCGFLAGATSKGLTFPLDTLRKRSQMHSVWNSSKTAPAISLFRTILVKEGIFGLYKGFGISILKTAPTSAISLFVYEYSITALRNWEQKQEKFIE